MINLTKYNLEDIEHQKLLGELIKDKSIRLNVSSILSPNNNTYVIDNDDIKIGLLKINKESNYTYSIDIGILEQYQNKKYGQIALKESEKYLNDWKILKVRTHYKNKKAISLAINNGFREDYIENEKCIEEGVPYKVLVKYNHSDKT